MKKILASLFLAIFSVSAIAQKQAFITPNYKKIAKATSKQGSKTWYPTLMNRLQANDTTLTPNDYHLLYYGYALRPNYNPYGKHPLADSLKIILSKEELSEADYKSIIRFGTDLITENPFEITLLDPLIYALWMSGESEMASKLEFRFGRLVETIFNSGDGLTKSTAFHVISVSHEYDMLRVLGFGFVGQQQLIEQKYDYLKVKKNDFDINGIYFDVGILFKSNSKKL